jgi:UDP-glucuronate decarboxylase
LKDQKRILITGGAGFVGSHLVDRLMLEGHQVIVADNFFTGSKSTIEHWIGHPNFELINHDIVNPLFIEGVTFYICIFFPNFSPNFLYSKCIKFTIWHLRPHRRITCTIQSKRLKQTQSEL